MTKDGFRIRSRCSRPGMTKEKNMPGPVSVRPRASGTQSKELDPAFAGMSRESALPLISACDADDYAGRERRNMPSSRAHFDPFSGVISSSRAFFENSFVTATKNTGTNSSASTTTAIMPPITVVPSAC